MAIQSEPASLGATRATELPRLFSSPQSVLLCTLVGFVLFLLFQTARFDAVLNRLVLLDNDDVMRLMQVRALIDGQPWFDTVQHRMLPPDGVSMHWSRYLDAILAGLVLVGSVLVDQAMAERLMLAVWPLVTFAAYLTVVVLSARSLFGLRAACWSALFAGFTSPFLVTYFGPGRIDHHNVQLLLSVALVGLLAQREQTFGRGVLAGTVVATSLAIGLETLPLIAAAPAIFAFRYLARSPGADLQLAGFGLGLPLAASVFFAGQTSPGHWGLVTCDTLSWPWLTMTWIGGVLAVGLAAFGRVSAAIPVRVAALVGSGLVVAPAAFMLLGDCLQGPYSQLPQAARDLISGQIKEAWSLPLTFQKMGVIMLPPLIPLATTVSGLALVLLIDARNRDPSAVLLVYLVAGFAAGLLQVRGLAFPLAAVPIAAGHIVNTVAALPRGGAARVALASAVVLALLAHPWLLLHRAIAGETGAKVGHTDDACLEPSVVEALGSLEKTRVLASLNLSTRILLVTGHDVLAGPYHRSPDAFLNGYQPFVGTEEDMRRTVDRFGAGLVVVCRGETYGTSESFGSRLAAGSAPAWLEPVEVPAEQLVVWRVRLDVSQAGEAGL